MNLYILRHGPAEDPSDWAPRSEALRPLTKPGIQRVKDVAHFLKEHDISFDVILTSPYERALRTAEIVAKTLDQQKKLVHFAPLAVGGNPEPLIHELSKHQSEWEDVLVVGHEPNLSQLISLLVTGRSLGSFELKKAGLAKLNVENPRMGACASLQMLLPPKLIR
jgi:phosphohistidine phosphatase